MKLFNTNPWSPEHKARLDLDGHIVLPGLLTDDAQARLTESLTKIQALSRNTGPGPNPSTMYAAEYDDYLKSLIAHPQMLELAHHALGDEIRYDHCVSLIRPGGNPGSGWHTHSYAEDRRELGFVRIFFYVNGFTPDDGGLKVVPGSHLFRRIRFRSGVDDEDLWSAWGDDRAHPATGKEMTVENLTAPPGTVALMWTHALHGVTPRQPGSETRWCVVYAYRNPGLPSSARRVSFAFEHKVHQRFGNLADLY